MGGSSNSREKRRHPRFYIDLPAEYRDISDSYLHGGIVVNASEGGFLIDTVTDIPLGTELSVTVLYPKEFELADLKVLTRIVRKETYWKEDSKINRKWKEYRYGLEFIQISDEDRWKLSLLLGGRSESEEIPVTPHSQHY